MGDSVELYRVELGQDGYHFDGAESDADSARAWDGAHGDVCLLSAVRDSPDEGWRVESSEVGWDVPDGDTYSSFDALVEAAAAGSGVTVDTAVCRCGERGGQCD